MKQFSITSRFLAFKEKCRNTDKKIFMIPWTLSEMWSMWNKWKNMDTRQQPELCRNSHSSMGLSEASLNRFIRVILSILEGCSVLGNCVPYFFFLIMTVHCSAHCFPWSILSPGNVRFSWLIPCQTSDVLDRCNRKMVQHLNDQSHLERWLVGKFRDEFKYRATATSPVVWGCLHLCNHFFPLNDFHIIGHIKDKKKKKENFDVISLD